MVEGGAHTAQAGRHITQRAAQHIQTVLNLILQFAQRQRARPARGQFDSQRHPLQQPADGGDSGCIFVSQSRCRIRNVVGTQPAHAVEKQQRGIVGFQVWHRIRVGRRQARRRSRRRGQSLQRRQPLLPHVEPLARGHQQLEVRRGAQQLRQQVDSVEQMLQIVQHQQHLLRAQKIAQTATWISRAQFGRVQAARDGGRQQTGRFHRRQVYEMDAVAEVGCLRRGRLDRQPRFAGAARPYDCEQTAIRVRQARGHLIHLPSPPDEGGGLCRQVVYRHLHGRRDLVLQALDVLRQQQTLANLFDKFAGFRLRLHTEFLRQHAHAFLVLAHGSRTVAGLGVEAHQGAVGRLVQGVQCQPAAGIGDCQVELPPSRLGVDMGQLVQHRRQFALQRLALQKLPGVELRRIRQREAGQEVAAIDVGGQRQGLDAAITQMGRGMVVRGGRSEQAAKLGDVHVQTRLLRQCELAIRAIQPLLSQRVVQRVERMAEIGSHAFVAQFRPEQSSQHIATVRLLRHGKIDEKANGLAPGHMDRCAVAFDMRRAEEFEGDGRQFDPSFLQPLSIIAEFSARRYTFCEIGGAIPNLAPKDPCKG